MSQQPPATPGAPIQVGDLVEVIYSCCNDQLGLFGRVDGWSRRSGDWVGCSVCAKPVPGQNEEFALVWGAKWPPSWLKRIPPLAELEGTKTEEDIREPA